MRATRTPAPRRAGTATTKAKSKATKGTRRQAEREVMRQLERLRVDHPARYRAALAILADLAEGVIPEEK